MSNKLNISDLLSSLPATKAKSKQSKTQQPVSQFA